MNIGRILTTVLFVLVCVVFADKPQANDSATAAYENALEQIDAGRYEEAINSLNVAIRLDPTFASAYLLRGVLNQVLKEAEAALDDFNEAVRLDPKNAEALNQRGIALIRLDRAGEAIPDFTKALKIDPNLKDAYLNRGRAYFERKRWKEAISDFSIVIDFDPENSEAFYYRGRAKLKNDDFKGMFVDLGEADRLDPDNPRALQTRAMHTAFYAGYGISSYSDAVADLETLINRNPKNEKALAGLALVYGVTCRFDKAIPLMQRAIELGKASGRNTIIEEGSLEKYQAGDESICVEKP